MSIRHLFLFLFPAVRHDHRVCVRWRTDTICSRRSRRLRWIDFARRVARHDRPVQRVVGFPHPRLRALAGRCQQTRRSLRPPHRAEAEGPRLRRPEGARRLFRARPDADADARHAQGRRRPARVGTGEARRHPRPL